MNLIKNDLWYSKKICALMHYITLVILGGLTWGILYWVWGDTWGLKGDSFRLASLGVVAWATGQILQQFTTLPPMLAALLTGIIARHLDFVDMRRFVYIDSFLRKIYPVIILGKGSLGWDVNYMRQNWKQIATLGTLPWSIEVAFVAISTHYLIGFPWIWGFLLGSVYASVSCPVVMPSVLKHAKNASGTVNWPQLICTAGGLDTALSVGIFGVIFSFMFYETDYSYRILKAALALFLGISLGVAWGSLAKFVPHSKDYYVTELRILFVLVGGLFCNFFTGAVGWGGTGGVAVLACNATAATYWAKDGWKLNQNPASTVYRVLWSFCEPVLFAFTGTFFICHSSISKTLLIGLGVLFACLIVRLTVTFVTCWHLKLKEKIFVCCTWIPKTIVEAVLCPLAIEALITSDSPVDSQELVYAEDLMRLIVQAILVTTPIGFLLTHYLGPTLLHCDQDRCESKDNKLRKESDGI